MPEESKLLTREEIRQASKEGFKEGAKEFFNEKYAELGRWSFRLIVAAAGITLLYFYLIATGWRK